MQDRIAATGNEIHRHMRLETLAAVWLEEIAATGNLSPQTVAHYGTDVRASITPQLGSLRLHECSTSRLDRFLKLVAKDHPAKAKRLKVVLAAVLGLAVRHDALPTNPVREVAGIRGSKNRSAHSTLTNSGLCGSASGSGRPARRSARRVHTLAAHEPKDYSISSMSC
jgi:hypothetical protein